MEELEKIFYTYIYLNPLKPGNFVYKNLNFKYEPFYVGKGKGKRINHHYDLVLKNKQDKNRHKFNTINQIISENEKPIIKKYSNNLLETQAFKEEMFLINLIGRKDLNDGPLLNLTNGGDGASGHIWQIGRKLSQETKNKISNTLKKTSIWVTNNPSKTKEHQKMMSNLLKERTFSNESRKKMSESSKGINHSKETKRKIGKSTKQRIEIYKTKEYRNKISKGNKGKKRNNIHKLNIAIGKHKNKIKFISDLIFVKENLNLNTTELLKTVHISRTTINRIKKKTHWSIYLDLEDMKV